MAQVFIERVSTANIDLLHEQLQSVSGYQACSTHPAGVTVYFSGNVDLQEIRAIVSAHDGTALSAKEMQFMNLISEIDSLKSTVGNIDSLTAVEATAAIKLLYKVLRVNDLI